MSALTNAERQKKYRDNKIRKASPFYAEIKYHQMHIKDSLAKIKYLRKIIKDIRKH